MPYTNHQVLIPPFTSPDVAGVTFGGFEVDKYPNSQPNARNEAGDAWYSVAHSGVAGVVPGLSKAGVPVWDYITMPQAMIAAANKGNGWHLTTAFERAGLAFLAKKLSNNDTRAWPSGGNSNLNPPQDILTNTEIAVLDKHLNNETGTYYRALPGTGPNNWSHNHMSNGVFDLNGLVYEWLMGLFIGVTGTDGHPEVLANLDVTYTGSPYGRGTISGHDGTTVLTCDGTGDNWLKAWVADAFNGYSLYIAEANTGAGVFYPITDGTATTLTVTGNPENGVATFCIVRHVAVDVGGGCTSGQRVVTLRDIDADLKPFAIPATTDATGVNAYGNDYYYFDKAALRAAIWGGHFASVANAGVFSLNLSGAPSYSNYNIGFRACKAL